MTNYQWKPKEKICPCGKEFTQQKPLQKYCSPICPKLPRLKSKKNFKKNYPKFKPSKTAIIHNRATKGYKISFLEKNGYAFCETCGSTVLFGMSVHHIMTAGRYPKHPELHNHKNLILVCIDCHTKFHSGKEGAEMTDKVAKERGLKDLFKSKNILNYGTNNLRE